MNDYDSLTIRDYEQLFEEDRRGFIFSSVWGHQCTQLLCEIKQNVAEGDVDELIRFLRYLRTETLEKFKSSWISKIWEKCFDATKNKFNTSKFYEKMFVITDNDICQTDKEIIFQYVCTTEVIDRLLSQVLEFQNHHRGTTIEANNFVIINREIVINKGEADNYTPESIDHLDNIIFSIRLFDSDRKLTILRNIIVSYIDLQKDNGKLINPAPHQINPYVQNEWYYIFIALKESEIVSQRDFTDVNFINQMVSWYPWLFHFESAEEMQQFKRKFAKSISAERGTWKYGNKKEVTPIKDMWARCRSLGIDKTKLEKLHPVASYLKSQLIEYKSSILKEKNMG